MCGQMSVASGDTLFVIERTIENIYGKSRRLYQGTCRRDFFIVFFTSRVVKPCAYGLHFHVLVLPVSRAYMGATE